MSHQNQRKLTSEQKILIVTELATFATPTEVKDRMKAEHGLDLLLSHIVCYDASTARGRSMIGAKYIQLFDETRARFIADCTRHAVAHKAYRLGRYQQMIERAKNDKMELRILRQAAMDAGDRYTNRRELTGKDGAPVQAVVAAVQFYLPDNNRGGAK